MMNSKFYLLLLASFMVLVGTQTFAQINSPVDISGCELWLDGADPNGDGSSASGALATWKDKSGAGNDATQSDTGLQAIVTPAGLNSRSVVTFDGTDDYYTFPAMDDVMTVFWVLKETNQITGNTGHFLMGATDGALYDFHRGTDTLWDGTYANENVRNGTTRVDGSDFDGINNNISADTFITISLVTTGPVHASQLTRDRDIGRVWSGDIAEVIIYNKALTTQEVSDVESYLQTKWFVATYPTAEVNGGDNNNLVQNGSTSASIDNGTDFGTAITGSSAINHTFTIKNTGNLDLNLTDTPAVTITGDNVFSISTQPSSTTIAGGASTTFAVSFNPSADGNYTATVSFANNDTNANPYTFVVKGAASSTSAPAMQVIGNGNIIQNGSTTPDPANNTDFGSVNLNTTVTFIYTIGNSGNDTLNLTGSTDLVAISGSNDFEVTQQPTITTLAPGDTATFSIAFTPTAANVIQADIEIASNDPGAPYKFKIQGTGTNGSGGIGPGGVSGCIMWLDANDPLADDSEPTAGQKDIWKDKSGANNDAVQGTTNNQPSIIANAINGNAVFSFDGSNQYFNLSNFTNIVTAFWVVRETDHDNPHFLLGASDSYDFHRGADAEIGNIWSSNAADVVKQGATKLDGNDVNGLTTQLPADGNYHILSLVTTGAAKANNLSKDRDIADRNWKGEMGEVILFDRALTDSEIQSIEDYLNNKWMQSTATPSIQVKGRNLVISNGSTTPSTDNDTDYGDTKISFPNTHTFTIANTGSGDLNISNIEITGTDAGDFNITSTIPASIPSAGVATVDIAFDPVAEGNKIATVSIESNDVNNSPYTFAIGGLATVAQIPVIVVKGGSPLQEIQNGDMIPNVNDNTNFGTLDLTTDISVSKDFVIENQGNTVLHLNTDSPVSFVGSNAEFYKVAPLSEINIDPGSSVTISVTFTPDTPGKSYTSTIRIVCDDPNNNPYEFAITGDTANPPPEDPAIKVSGNGVNIPNDSSHVPNVSDNTDFGQVEIGQSVTHSFTITNSGTANLKVEGVNTTGNGFSATILGTTPITIAPGDSINFDVQFTATNPAQVVNGSINISNDTRIDNPFTIQIVGEAIEPIEPNVNVVWNGQSIATGSTPSLTNGTDFGQQTVNEPIEREFQIVNTGNADLNLTSAPIITLTGSAVFTVTQQPTRTVIPQGSSAIFTIQFLPTTLEQLTATVSFECDAPGKSPYTFTIQGIGIQGSVSSSINVEGNGIYIENNDTTPMLADLTDFGTVNAGSKLDHTFTIKNTSSQDLELIGNELIHITGLGMNEFAITQEPDSLIKAGDSSTFVITYTPSALGETTATISIDNNTEQSNPFTFNVHGIGSNGTPDAFMRVIANNKLVANGSTDYSVDNNTDFGTVEIGVGKELIFQVENAGNDTLTFDDPGIQITGNNSTSFIVVQNLTPIQAGDTQSFSIKFSPDTIGEKNAIVSITNNDSAKNPYTFAVQGIAFDPNELPKIVVSGNDIEITNGSTTPSVDNGTDFGNASVGLDVTQEFTIFNDSFSNLTLDGSPAIKISGTNASDFTVTSEPTSKLISAKSQVKFTIDFKPSTAGNKSATVTIENNAEEFIFDIAGTTLGNTPIAQPDSYTVETGEKLVVPNPGVLSNDTDPNGETLIAIKETDPTKGIVFLNEDGSFAYTPNDGMTGTDSFTYKAKNSSTESQPTTVTIEIVATGTSTPIAVDDTYTTTKNAILDIPATGVLANDINGSGQSLSATLVATPATGTLTLNEDGSFSYTPDNQVGTVTFTYTASNGSVTSAPATVTINVNETGTNNPPVALSDSYSMTQNTTLTISSPGILANDTDADGGILTAVLVSDVASGALELNANGSFSYIPATDFIGSVVFSYKANDGIDYSNVVTVSISVNATGTNNPPIAVPSNYVVAKNQKLVIPAPGILSNDMDPDGDPLTAVLVGSTSNGQLTLNSDGSFEYTASVDYVGSDSFSYKANDGQLNSNIVSVTITIDPNMLPGVTEGMLFSNGDSSGKAVAIYVDPVKGRSRTLRLKSVDSKLLWNKAVTLYNKSDYRYSLHKGNPTSNWIKANPIKQLACTIYPAGGDTPWHVGINPPELTSIERWDGSDFTNGIHTNSVFVLKGRYFGSKVPRVTLEYIDAKKNVKQIRLKVDKNNLLYANYKGKEGTSPMDPETGISELRVALPGKDFYAPECWVVLVSKTGIASDVQTKTLPSFTLTSGNTPPIANNDTFVLEGGQKSYMLDVLSNDTDAESDNVIIMPSGKTSNNGGKLKVLGYRIQYTPKGGGSGDSFTYTIDDGHGGQSTATVTIK